MENLLNPNLGMMFWTVVTFLSLVLLLKKFAWGPILKAIDDRDEALRQESLTAQKNREQTEQIRAEYEQRMADVEHQSRMILWEAEQKAAEKRESLMKVAETEAHNLIEKTRAQLQSEKNNLVRELRENVVRLSIQATEKLIAKNVTEQTQEKFFQDMMTDLENQKRAH